MADEKIREPAAVWYTHVGRQVWRTYGKHPQTMRTLDVADEHAAADGVMRDLDRLAALDAALEGAGTTVDEVRAVMDRARKATESAAVARAEAEKARRERDQAVKVAQAAKRDCKSACEQEEETAELHIRLCHANDKPSVRRVWMWLQRHESYTSWLGLVK